MSDTGEDFDRMKSSENEEQKIISRLRKAERKQLSQARLLARCNCVARCLP